MWTRLSVPLLLPILLLGLLDPALAVGVRETVAFAGVGRRSSIGTINGIGIATELCMSGTDVRTAPSSSSSAVVVPRSVNYFISRKCNYSVRTEMIAMNNRFVILTPYCVFQCKFCFHTAKTYHALHLEQSTKGLHMLADAGTKKINFAGGEPFLHPILLGELCRIASDELGIAVSIISNGSKITPEWMKVYGRYVDVLGVSVDSFDAKTNAAIGRGGDAENGHVQRMIQVRDLCYKHNIMFKLNTVVNSMNWDEDMNDQIADLDPVRWKVFQVLLLEGENAGGSDDLRDARDLCIEREKFDAFVHRHSERKQLIPEPNDVMQNSYLLLDEELRFLDCSSGGKVPGRSILDVGVDAALMDAGFDENMFNKRGGIFEWRRPREA